LIGVKYRYLTHTLIEFDKGHSLKLLIATRNTVIEPKNVQ